MQEEDFEREVKVLVVGNGGVGKTSMIRRFCKGLFTDAYKKTIGVDFLEKRLYVKSLGEDVKLMLWDTAGQEEFDSMTRTYYRGAGAAVLCFSSTDRASFEAVQGWKRKVETECGNIAMVLVQNKLDLLDSAVISRAEAEELANAVGLKFYRTCVKENLNVSEVFEYLAGSAVESQHKASRSLNSSRVHSIEQPRSPRGVTSTSLAASRLSTGFSERQGAESVVTLKPTRQRTGGKKRVKDRLADCSIV